MIKIALKSCIKNQELKFHNVVYSSVKKTDTKCIDSTTTIFYNGIINCSVHRLYA